MGRGSGGCVETALNDKLQVFTCKAQQDAGSPSQVIDEVCACLASDKAEEGGEKRAEGGGEAKKKKPREKPQVDRLPPNKRQLCDRS